MPKAKQQPFSHLSAAKKRIAIAKDVLAQIKAGRYNIEGGTWLSIDTDSASPDSPDNPFAAHPLNLTPEQTQALLMGGKIEIQVPAATCTCCAIGAACASAVRLFNRHAIRDGKLFEDFTEGFAILRDYFSKDQCVLIESAFEKRDPSKSMDDEHNLNGAELAKAQLFGTCYNRDENRAVAIFTNIIRHRGTFVP